MPLSAPTTAVQRQPIGFKGALPADAILDVRMCLLPRSLIGACTDMRPPFMLKRKRMGCNSVIMPNHHSQSVLR